MYVTVENEKVVLELYDDGSYIVHPKSSFKTEFEKLLKEFRQKKISRTEFEESLGIPTLLNEGIQKYRDFLPELKNALKDFESFIDAMEAVGHGVL